MGKIWFPVTFVCVLLLACLTVRAEAEGTDGQEVNLRAYMAALGVLQENYALTAKALAERRLEEARKCLDFALPAMLPERYQQRHDYLTREVHTAIDRLATKQPRAVGPPATEPYSMLGAPELVVQRDAELDRANKLSRGDLGIYAESLVTLGRLSEAEAILDRFQLSNTVYHAERLAVLREFMAAETFGPVAFIEKYYLPHGSNGPIGCYGDLIVVRVWNSPIADVRKLALLAGLFDLLRDRTGQMLAVQEAIRLPDAGNDPAVADVAFAVGMHLYREQRLDEAVQFWMWIVDNAPSYKEWGKATFNAGLALRESNCPREAIPLFMRLLRSNVDDCEPGGDIMETHRNYRHRACLQMATCYEDLYEFKWALFWVLRARDVYRFQTWCGTCHDDNAGGVKQRIALLIQLAKLTTREPKDAAEAAALLLPTNGNAQRLLARIGEPAVPSVLRALGESDAEGRRAAACVFRQWGRAAAQLAPKVANSLKDEDPGVRRRVAEALQEIGCNDVAVVQALLRSRMEDSNQYVRDASLAALRALPPNPDTLELLMKALPTAGTEDRLFLIWYLGRLGAGAAPAASLLVGEFRVEAAEASQSRNHSNVNLISAVLVEVGAAAVPPLIDCLMDDHLTVQSVAASTLGKIGPDAKEALPALIASAADADLFHTALPSLRKIGMDPSALPALMVALKREDNPHDTQYYLIESAGQLGPKARDAIPVLSDIAGGTQGRFGYLATRALGRIGGEAMPRIVELLKHGDSSVRSSAIRVLGEVDPSVRETAVRALVSALHHEEWWTRMQAAEVLGTFGPAANDALPRLEELGENPAHTRERICMVMAVWRISGDDGPAVEKLSQIMDSRDSTTRRRAAEALEQIFARAEEALRHDAID